MIDELIVKNLALIAHARLSFAPGLTVLTGETGAGKTALISALKLIMGERAHASSLRFDSESLEVSARLYIDPNDDAQDTTVFRSLSKDKKTRVMISGSIASVQELKQRIAPFLDLCGQHAQQQLLNANTHASLLDAFIGKDAFEALARYRTQFARVEEVKAALVRTRDLRKTSQEKLDALNYMLERTRALDPKVDEYEELLSRTKQAESARDLYLCAHDAYEALVGEGGASDRIDAATARLQAYANIAPQLAEYVSTLSDCASYVSDVSRALSAFWEHIDLNAHDLEHMQERIAALQDLMRAYGPTLNDVLSKAEAAKTYISRHENSDEIERALEEGLVEEEHTLKRYADELNELRAENSSSFEEALNQVLRDLRMANASISLTQAPFPQKLWTSNGPSRVELLFRPGKAAAPLPFAQIASGGEMSRVMLAIKVILGARDPQTTFVFDEVDAGVGGETATLLAKMLYRLSAHHQVIVVTHLAQVAVYADTHYKVSKTTDDLPKTNITALSETQRVTEIARMLSGDVSDLACAHAQAMLTEAAATKAAATKAHDARA